MSQYTLTLTLTETDSFATRHHRLVNATRFHRVIDCKSTRINHLLNACHDSAEVFENTIHAAKERSKKYWKGKKKRQQLSTREKLFQDYAITSDLCPTKWTLAKKIEALYGTEALQLLKSELHRKEQEETNQRV